MAAAAAAALITAASTPFPLVSFRSRRDGHLSLSPPRRPGAGRCRASAPTFQGGPAASYAREMERLSAKESLLLAVSSSLPSSSTWESASSDLPLLVLPGTRRSINSIFLASAISTSNMID